MKELQLLTSCAPAGVCRRVCVVCACGLLKSESGKTQNFTFNRAFGEYARQEEVYEYAAQPMVEGMRLFLSLSSTTVL